MHALLLIGLLCTLCQLWDALRAALLVAVRSVGCCTACGLLWGWRSIRTRLVVHCQFMAILGALHNAFHVREGKSAHSGPTGI